MKVFIAGARSVTSLNKHVQDRLRSIYKNGYDVLIGDCVGVDTAVQNFFIELHYNNITVFASNGHARNNIGNWMVQNVPVPDNVRGFDFYKQKDIAMANNADYGFMIWDGQSRGTLNNIINLIQQNKKVLIYLVPVDKMIVVGDFMQLSTLIRHCPRKTQIQYQKLLDAAHKSTSQMSLI